MANIKSAKKRISVIAKKTMRNKIIKSKVKTAIKRFLSAVEAKDIDNIKLELRNAIKAIDKASSKGVFHKNNAARKKSRLAKIANTCIAAL